jgi:hypothetical protein
MVFDLQVLRDIRRRRHSTTLVAARPAHATRGGFSRWGGSPSGPKGRFSYDVLPVGTPEAWLKPSPDAAESIAYLRHESRRPLGKQFARATFRIAQRAVCLAPSKGH